MPLPGRRSRGHDRDLPCLLTASWPPFRHIPAVINNGVRRQAIAHLEDHGAGLGPDQPDLDKRRPESSGEQAGRPQVAQTPAVFAENSAAPGVYVVEQGNTSGCKGSRADRVQSREHREPIGTTLRAPWNDDDRRGAARHLCGTARRSRHSRRWGERGRDRAGGGTSPWRRCEFGRCVGPRQHRPDEATADCGA